MTYRSRAVLYLPRVPFSNSIHEPHQPQVYGPIHKTTGQCYTQLARVCYRANNILQVVHAHRPHNACVSSRSYSRNTRAYLDIFVCLSTRERSRVMIYHLTPLS